MSSSKFAGGMVRREMRRQCAEVGTQLGDSLKHRPRSITPSHMDGATGTPNKFAAAGSSRPFANGPSADVLVMLLQFKLSYNERTKANWALSRGPVFCPGEQNIFEARTTRFVRGLRSTTRLFAALFASLVLFAVFGCEPVPCFAQYIAPYVTVQGALSNSSGLAAANGTLTFQPNTIFFVAGTSTIVTSSQCATDANGNVVGVGNPVTGPRVTTQFTGTLPSGNYYVQFTWYDQFGNQTLPSPEVRIQLTAVGELQILPPVGSGPPQAVGMDVYIGAASGAEQYQGQTTSLTAQYTQAVALVTGAVPPPRNGTPCRVIANDAAWPTGTGYNVSLVDASGNTLFVYPQMWQFLGPGSAYNLSQGIPYYNGMVTYPVPVLTQPTNHNMQAINGPLSMGTPGGNMYNIVNVNEVGVGTYLPAWGVDVEGSGLASEINAKGGYLIGGAAPPSGTYCAGSTDGIAIDSYLPCVGSLPTLYYQTVQNNSVAVGQEANLNFSSEFQVANPFPNTDSQTNVDLAFVNTISGSCTFCALSYDRYGRVSSISSGSPSGNTLWTHLGTASCSVSTNYVPCPNTITFSPAMPDTTYGAVCWGADITASSGNAGLYLYEIRASQTTTTFQVDVESNSTGTGQQYGDIVCIVHHN